MNLMILTADASSRYAADDYKTVATLSIDSPKACPFYDDLRTEKIEDFADTYEFSVPSNYQEAQHITRGNFVIFQDETYKYRLFRIYDAEDTIYYGIHVKKAYAENAFVNDLLKKLVPRAKLGTVNFRDAFAHCLSNSGWQIKQADYLGELINKEYDGTTTAQSEIQAICKDYRGEIDAYVELNEANKIIGKYFNLVEERGRNDTGRRFEYRRDLTGATRKESDAELYTAIKARGKDGLTFAKMNNGSDTIYDSAANDLYNGGREYLVKYVEFSDAETEAALYALTHEELQKCNKPRYEYTIETALLEQYAGYESDDVAYLGDNVRVVDFEMVPEMTVGARIIEKQTSFTDASKNAVVLGEYVEIVNTTPDDIKKLQDKLTTINDGLSKIYRVEIRASAGTVAKNGFLQTTGDAVLEAVVYKDNVRIVGSNEQYVWEKVYRKTGEHDTAWEAASKGIGNIIKVTGEDYAKNCDFYCHFLDDAYNFVATNYFKVETERVVSIIEGLKDTHAIIAFGTDLHYATDGLEDAQAKLRAIEHARNIVEVTHQVDCDLVVNGGDLIDGKTSKALASANLQAMSSTLQQSDCPVLHIKGNHDDNSLGDVRQHGATGTAIIKPSQMSAILKSFYLQSGVQYNSADDAMYCHYDIDDKKLRVIVLDAWDIRYDLLDNDKKIKYQARKYAGFQNTQVRWLAQVLQTVPSDWGVAVFTHMALGGVLTSNSWTVINEECIVGILNAWRTGGVYKSSTMTNENADHPVSELIAAYDLRGKGKLIGIFAGHTHKDVAKRIGFGQTPTILTNCSYAAGDNDDTSRRVLGTVDEDCFDVIAINVTTNDIQMIRFGARSEGRAIRQYVGGA